MDLQHVQWWEERAVEAKLILGGISNVLQAIIDYYASLLSHRNFSLSTTCRPDVESLAAQMRDAIADCKMQRDRAELLTQIASQRKTLVHSFYEDGYGADISSRSCSTFSLKLPRKWRI